ncbi:MAG: phosphate signaling complex protein PhoU [Flavobacteriia bacterium]|nr:phosphate signaling complex protein PhoU [Flavobacteriia bacterium]
MLHNEQELIYLREEINQMWKLVISQVTKTKQALLNNDVELALEIIKLEKRVDGIELKIDSSCEHYIALYSPVAIDLRFVLSIMKISITLERIADYAAGVAHYVTEKDCHAFTSKMKEMLEIERMFDLLLNMLTDSLTAFNTENTKSAGKILSKDKEVNKIFNKAFETLLEQLKKENKDIGCGLNTIMAIRKLERIGDHCSNIVEEIVFFVEAKVLKHKGKNK